MAEPMHWRIAQHLRQEIESGKLRPGQPLPTERELREQYAVSRSTVRDAIRWLSSRALVEARPGQGIFVANRLATVVITLSADARTGQDGGGAAAPGEVGIRGGTLRSATRWVEIQRVGDTVAELLGVAAGTLVLSRHQERYIDGTPWSLQTSFYPMDLVTAGAQRLIAAEDITEGTVAYLRQTLQLTQVGYRDQLLVRPAYEAEAKFFGLPDNGRLSVVAILRTCYAESPDGPVPFRVTLSVYRADRNQFVMNSGAVADDRHEAGEHV